MNEDHLVVVAGAGGFIGGHLVRSLLERGAAVRAVDIKPKESWYQYFPEADNRQVDLSEKEGCYEVVRGASQVFNLAADMGGMGFIENNKALCMLSVLINTHLLMAARELGVERFFYASSACVYAADKQCSAEVAPLKESDAYPALPEDGYGWEKLFSERMCRHFLEDFGLQTRTARYHNVFGPCFDEETEILTRQGWKPFALVSHVDEVATLDPATGFVEYQCPVAIQSYDYAGPMHRIRQKRVDLLITPDHGVWYSPNHKSPFRLGKIGDRRATTMYFSRGARWRGECLTGEMLPAVTGTDGRLLVNRGGDERFVLSDDWLRFLGWYISEGSAFQTPRNYVVCITQYDEVVRTELCDLLRRMGFRPSVNTNNVLVFSKQLYETVVKFGHAQDKYLPRELLDLPPEQLGVLFETLMRGDGDADGGRYSTCSRLLADDVQELAFKLGLGATISQDGRMYRVYISRETVHRISPEHRSVEHYEGRVYDVTVPEHHVIMVRRNGKMVWSGNCGTYEGGREKAPSAICRKVVQATLSGSKEIEIWGDGEQTRSFTYIDDCVHGTNLIMASDVSEPLNLGSDQLVTINQLVDMVEAIAGVKLERRYKLDAPQGVRGRNSDNSLIQARLGWAPSITLEEGLEKTYGWVRDQMTRRGA